MLVMMQISKGALLALVWLALALVSRSLAHGATETLPVWLGSGVTFAVLLVGPRWTWPALLAGAALASLVWGVLAHQLSLLAALAFALIEVSSMALGAWIATRGRLDAQSPAGSALMIAGALVASTVGATLAVALWGWQRPGADLAFEWRTWALSTLVGLLLVAPLVTAFRGFRIMRSGGLAMTPFLGGAAAFVAFVVAALLVFATHAQQRWGDVAATLAYVPMPFLLVASLLWGPRGGAMATLLGSLLIIARTSQGGGPFAIHEATPGESVVEVQGFVLAWTTVLLLTRALAEGRRVALARARDWQLRYERTLQAVGVASVEYDAVTGRATWGDGALQVLGADAVGADTHAAWLDRVDPAERGLVQAAWQAVASGSRPAADHAYMLHSGAGRVLRVREQLAAVQGGDGRVEQVVALLTLVRAEPVHG